MARPAGHASPLCLAQASQVIVVDMQPRLASAMAEADRERIYRNLGLLLEVAKLLGVPAAATEQYPRGLGSTVPAIAARLPEDTRLFAKTSFSCCGAEGFVAGLDIDKRPQLVLAGMESHVCVLQTALDLSSRGFQAFLSPAQGLLNDAALWRNTRDGLAVFVAEDAVCSRNPENHRNAMDRLRHAAVTVTNTESVIFEWLRDAKHEKFKAVSALLK